MNCSTPALPVHHQLPEFWCHPAISSSVVPFASCPQSLPASGSFPTSQLFAWGGHFTSHAILVCYLGSLSFKHSTLESPFTYFPGVFQESCSPTLMSTRTYNPPILSIILSLQFSPTLCDLNASLILFSPFSPSITSTTKDYHQTQTQYLWVDKCWTNLTA